MKILVVEDHPLNLELTTTVLELRGHEVDAAVDGAALRRYLADGAAPEAVLMDIQLPDVDGVTLLEELRAIARFESLPVIALTAHALEAEGHRLLAAGFDAVMTKPIDTRRFAADVEEVVRSGRRTR